MSMGSPDMSPASHKLPCVRKGERVSYLCVLHMCASVHKRVMYVQDICALGCVCMGTAYVLHKRESVLVRSECV